MEEENLTLTSKVDKPGARDILLAEIYDTLRWGAWIVIVSGIGILAILAWRAIADAPGHVVVNLSLAALGSSYLILTRYLYKCRLLTYRAYVIMVATASLGISVFIVTYYGAFPQNLKPIPGFTAMTLGGLKAVGGLAAGLLALAEFFVVPAQVRALLARLDRSRTESGSDMAEPLLKAYS